METAALTPPPWLERIVLLAIPACAREAVAGDLWETCAGARAYAIEALRTVPFVIASQMRRNLNLPALMLQAGLAQFCFGGAAGALALPLLALRDAYQPVGRPSHRRALREAVVVAFCGLLLLQAVTGGLHRTNGAERDFLVFLQLFFIGPVFLPVLCFLRAGVIVDGDRRSTPLPREMSREELAAAFNAFRQKACRRNFVESVALALAALMLTLLHPDMPQMTLAALFAVASAYLLLEDLAPRGEHDADFVSLRALYQKALLRHQQLRRFLWWLWLSPALVALQGRFIASSLAMHRPLTALPGAAAGVLLCFLVAALNRDGNGRIQEQVGELDNARQRTV